MTLYIVCTALLIMSASLVGVFTINSLLGEKIQKNLPHLISFSAGVFLFTAVFMMIESMHILENIFYVGALVVMGYLGAIAINKILPHFHHHHDDDCAGHIQGKRVLIGDSIHNIADGLILVPAFLVSPWLGVGTALSIFVHELLQELSEFFVLRNAGYSVKKALFYNLLTSSTIFIGIGVSLFLSKTDSLEAILLSISAGFFLQLVFSDLLPHKPHASKKELGTHILLIIIGLLLIGLINTLFAH